MSYVDIAVASVPVENKERYLEIFTDISSMHKENGAIQVIHCWGDEVPEGEITSFPRAVDRKDGEQIAVMWMLWPSKEVRNEAAQRAMEDARLKGECTIFPFDGKRMISAGFDVISE